MYTVDELRGVTGLAFEGSQLHVVTEDGEVKASVTLAAGEFDPGLYTKYAEPGELFQFEGVRLVARDDARVRPIARGQVQTGANADWKPSAAEREKRMMEARLASLEKTVGSQVDRAVQAALAAAESKAESEKEVEEIDPEKEVEEIETKEDETVKE